MFCRILCCFVAKCWFMQFCRDICFVAIYALLRGEKFSQELRPVEKMTNMRYGAIAIFRCLSWWVNGQTGGNPDQISGNTGHISGQLTKYRAIIWSLASLHNCFTFGYTCLYLFPFPPPSSLSAAPFYIPTGWSDQLSNWSVLVKAGWEQSRPGFSNLASSLCSSCLSPCLPLLAGADTVFKCPPPSIAFPRYS